MGVLIIGIMFIAAVPYMLSLTDTTLVNAYFVHFEIFIPMELSLHRASNDAINCVVL